MQLTTIRIDKPDATNFILGQTHFIKSVEDIHETLVGAVPGIKFGLAFCEASCLLKRSFGVIPLPTFFGIPACPPSVSKRPLSSVSKGSRALGAKVLSTVH